MANNIVPINKEYLLKFLKPVSRLAESCVLKTDIDGIYTICSSSDTSVFLYARVKFPLPEDIKLKLNLINISKLITGLQSLEDGEFTLENQGNNIKCSSTNDENDTTYFVYHLVDDSIVKEPTISIKRISELNFDTKFSITTSKIKQLMSGYSFASDISKIYFYTKDGKVFAEINDKTLQNVDNISFKVSDSFDGDPITEPIVISIEIFKNLASCRTDINVKINNQHKVFIFSNKDDDDGDLKYIISALVK